MKLEYCKTWKVAEAEFFWKFLVFGNRVKRPNLAQSSGFLKISLERYIRFFYFFLHEIRPYYGLSEVIVVSLPKIHLGVAQGSKGEILPCCIRLLFDYLLSSLSVKHIHYLHKACVYLEFCLSHFFVRGSISSHGLVNYKNISHRFPVFLFLTLNK